MVASITALSVELRLKIYDFVLQSTSIHSIRPQRRIGWNRPHADLSHPAALFDDDSHPVLKALFSSKITRHDHQLILGQVLRRVRVMLVDHADLAALLKICDVNRKPATSSKDCSSVVRHELRMIDFVDRLDDVVCQPADLRKLIRGLRGLKKISLTSHHCARFSGNIEEHIDFVKERALLDATQDIPKAVPRKSIDVDLQKLVGRMSLKSPVTDGSRMLSPALVGYGQSSQVGDTWVTVDLSMLVWQHYLYTGAPYKDHWRSVKMQTLLSVAESRSVEVILGFRRVEFDPLFPDRSGHADSRIRSYDQRKNDGSFRAEMSTQDWCLKFLARKSFGGVSTQYKVRQKKAFNEPVSQDGV